MPKADSLDSPKRVQRFLREAKAAANLRHPHIVPVYDAGTSGGQHYIASAFIAGKSLSDEIPEKGTAFERAARLTRELAEALAYAHTQGIVHRDVKPVNIMVDAQDHIHLTDFGLALRQEDAARLTNDGALMGTPSYMSPEQASCDTDAVGPASDQYSCGVGLYELLTGRVPFEGGKLAVLHSVIYTDPEPPESRRAKVPADLSTICRKAMAKRPQERYADCQALADDLRRWQEGEPIAAREHTRFEKLFTWMRRNPTLAAYRLSGGVASIALLIFIIMLLFNSYAMRQSRLKGYELDAVSSQFKKLQEDHERLKSEQILDNTAMQTLIRDIRRHILKFDCELSFGRTDTWRELLELLKSSKY